MRSVIGLLMTDDNKFGDNEFDQGHYEYRVWGKHRSARRKIEGLASQEIRERFEDCYLLVDDADWNAKIRDSTLKLKQRVSNKRGFERWTSNWHPKVESTPAPFDSVFEDLSLERPEQGKDYDISRAVEALGEDPEPRVVFVNKRRRRYRIGSMKAEITKLDIPESSTRLHTIAIQGNNVKRLDSLLRELGLHGLPNVPMHVALENQGLIAKAS